MTEYEAITLIIDELRRAEKLWPKWPIDPIHAAAVVDEESGEIVKAVNNWVYKNESDEKVAKEAVQTGAMALRFLMNMPNYIPNKYPGGSIEP